MTSNLIKYEFRSSIKLMSMIWAAVLVVSILMSIIKNLQNGSDLIPQDLVGIAFVITIILYVAVMLTLVVFNFVVVIARFYTSLLGDEGYLMNTLPVKTWQLITAKGFTAACLLLGSTIVGAISIMILVGSDSLDAIKIILGDINDHPIMILIGIEMLVIVIAELLKSVYQIYAAIAIGQLVNRCRILLAVGAYVGINIVLTTIASFAIIIMNATGLDYGISSATMVFNEMATFQFFLIFVFIIEAIQLVAFHIVSERLLNKKLNLL